MASLLITGCSGKVDPKNNQITLGTEYEDVVMVWGEPTRELAKIVGGHGLVYFKNDYYLAYFQEGVWLQLLFSMRLPGIM